jgi:hypothetical protein
MLFLVVLYVRVLAALKETLIKSSLSTGSIDKVVPA